MSKYCKTGSIGIILTALLFCFNCVQAETIVIFYDPLIPQHAFAARDIKAALMAKGIQPDMLTLDTLSSTYTHRKVVIALASHAKVTEIFANEGGDPPAAALGEQAYALRTTTHTETSYWVLGGDINGAMYGGLQIAENIGFHGFGPVYNTEESPYLLHRCIKFNIPFDVRSPTYYSSGFSQQDFRGTSTRRAITDVWDLNFWQAWFDEMARYRYNGLCLWSLHPFTSMITLPDYPEVALQDVQGFDGFAKKMSMEEKIAFWRAVMRLARNRGFEFYMLTWNLYTYGATGKYGIDNDPANPNTIPYMRQCMTRFLETYPDLTGFGVTAGENMGDLDNAKEAEWMWSTYGQGFYDYASTHKERKLVFMHRYHGSGAEEVAANFKPLLTLPNVRFDFSFKYAVAHIYSTTNPNFIRTRYGDVPAKLDRLGLKTWLELRNDDFYFLHWGDPDFVRRYIAGFPDKDRHICGAFMGSDGYTFTRVFTSKADWAKDELEVKRLWYTNMLWGRLTYNPMLSDEVFKQTLATKYPSMSPTTLFTAWAKASQGVPLMTELVQGSWISDFRWWPEACMARKEGFRTIEQMVEAEPPPGSNLCSIAETVAGTCGDKTSAYDVADRIEASAQEALRLIGPDQTSPTSSELQTNLGNIRALSYLSLYYAEKIRGACYKAAQQMDRARDAMGRADCYWRQYSSLMNTMYTGMDMQRTRVLPDWLSLDDEVRAEYTALGGKGDPNYKDIIESSK